jgi:hypothetical protein
LNLRALNAGLHRKTHQARSHIDRTTASLHTLPHQAMRREQIGRFWIEIHHSHVDLADRHDTAGAADAEQRAHRLERFVEMREDQESR